MLVENRDFYTPLALDAPFRGRRRNIAVRVVVENPEYSLYLTVNKV